MGHSSLTGIEPPPIEPPGHDVDLLGPSDSSDSGSDSVGSPEGDADTDAAGTGERRSVAHDVLPPEGRDIGVDRVFSAETADEVDGGDDDAEPVDEDTDEDGELASIDEARADDGLEDEAPESADDATTEAPSQPHPIAR